ncbi:MAG: GAF domain-containing protein, partial [Armatimonadetes bacterium]|nr:GAF domain-containing protein [Armatimonadota bacterium]
MIEDDLEAAERRANVRLHRVLAIEVEHDGEFRRLFAVDVSASGFRVAGEFPLPRGASLRIKLHLRSGPSVEGIAKAVWTQALELGLYQSGCEFEQLASPEDFKSLLNYIERERLTGDAAPPQELELEAQVALRDLTSREVDRLAVLARICELMNSSYQFHEVWERVLRVAVEATGAERGLLLLDRGGTEMEVPVAHGTSPDSPAGLNYSRSVVDQVMKSGQPLLSLDAMRDERLARSTSLKVLGTRSILCVPMSSRERNLGLIYLDNSIRAGVFTDVDLQLASVIAGLAAAAVERTEYFSQLLQNEKMAAMGTMMAGIVHELNNP